MMKMLKSLLLALAFVLALGAAQAMESRANYAMLIDAKSGVVLYEKNADARMSPASMSKLMTVLLVFEAIESGAISTEEEFLLAIMPGKKAAPVPAARLCS